ncbi:MAG: restriction endonuclease subunit S [Rhodospirillales bacterium]|nr:restriction endonuclease subunit S [Rhodospirillales bacterium]
MIGWSSKPLEQCLDRFKVPAKVPKKKFAERGAFPIVSQEAEFINGYWENLDDVCKLDSPVVVYGDHTQVTKFVDFDFVVGADGVKVLKPKEFLDPKYLFYFVLGHPADSLGYARHFRHMKSKLVPIPPLAEQQRIVAILDEAFEGIDKAIVNAEQNVANAQELFESYINALFHQNEVAWANRKLDHVCSFENGDRGKNYPGRKAFVPSGVPFINAGHLEDGTIHVDSMNYIPQEHFDLLSNGKVRNGDILFCLRGSLGKYGRVENIEQGAIASSLVIVRSGNEILADYLSAYFGSLLCRTMIGKYESGAAQPNLSARDLKQFDIPVPPMEVQKSQIKELSATRSETQRLKFLYQHKLEALAELRQSILRKAFSGELTAREVAA